MAASVAGGLRPRYRERQLLTAGDLSAEQGYLVAARRRHLVASHSWGIVTGLAPVAGADGLIVTPGLAVDGYGRELVVTSPVGVPLDVFDRLGSELVAVWLVYGQIADDGDWRGRRERGADGHVRWREEPCVQVTSAAGAALDPRHPPGVPAGTSPLPTAGSAAPPWPVLLGTVARDGPLSVELHGRPYAGAVGERVGHPSATVAVDVGRAGFAVTVDGAQPIAVGTGGATAVRADVVASGELALEPGADAGGLRFSRASATPDAAAPWRIYRTRPPGERTDELRLEIAPLPVEGEPERFRLAIGCQEADGSFRPCLVVTPDCRTTISGDLVTGGRVIPAAVGIDPANPEFVGAVVNRWIAGISIASATAAEGTAALAIDQGLAGGFTGSPGAVYLGGVTVKNPGLADVLRIVVTATVARAGLKHVADALLAGPFDLAPAEQFSEKPRLVGVPNIAAGDAEVTVTATGETASGQKVSAVARRTVKFARPGPLVFGSVTLSGLPGSPGTLAVDSLSISNTDTDHVRGIVVTATVKRAGVTLIAHAAVVGPFDLAREEQADHTALLVELPQIAAGDAEVTLSASGTMARLDLPVTIERTQTVNFAGVLT